MMARHQALDSDDEEWNAVGGVSVVPMVTDSKKNAGRSSRSTVDDVDMVKALLKIDAEVPILDRKDMVPLIRECPKNLGPEARKGKMAADIQYPMERVEADNQVLDESMYRAWCAGANFFTYMQRPRQSHHAKTNVAKVERAKKDEMIGQCLPEVNVHKIMDAYFPDVDKEGGKSADGKLLYNLINTKLAELEGGEGGTDGELRTNLTKLKSDIDKQRQVQRTMALKRKERTSANYVITAPSLYPVNGQAWLKRSLARVAVSATRKVEKKVCSRCKELISSKEGICAWYSKDDQRCHITEGRLYVDGIQEDSDVLPKMKLNRQEFCIHAREEALK